MATPESEKHTQRDVASHAHHEPHLRGLDPNASPHRQALYAPDAAYVFHKRHDLIPETPEAERFGTDEHFAEDQEPRHAEEPVREGVSDFVQWLSALRRPQVSSTSAAEYRDTRGEPEHQTSHPGPPTPEKQKRKTKKGSGKKKAGKKKAGKKKVKKKEKNAIPSNVVLSQDIFSETLAELLASQGHVDQAIQMYETMGLIYPEKSRLFAAKIEELKNR